jgi:chemotaxis signal transduction protein
MGFVILSVIVILAFITGTVGFIVDFIKEIDERTKERRIEHYRSLSVL